MKARFFLFMTLISLMYGCDCIQGEGELINEKRDVSGFDRIKLDMSARIILTQDSSFSMMIEAQENILDILTTDVNNATLDIDLKEFCITSHEPITIFISMPEIKKLEINSSGKIIAKNMIRAKKIDLEIDGSGDIIAGIKAEKIYADINGSGEIELGGICKSLSVDINGSGEFYGMDLKSSDADIDISGSGNCTIYVLDELKVDINGSGDVRYKGDPDLNTDISGSGNVKKIKR